MLKLPVGQEPDSEVLSFTRNSAVAGKKELLYFFILDETKNLFQNLTKLGVVCCSSLNPLVKSKNRKCI